MTAFLKRDGKPALAYNRIAAQDAGAGLPAVLFLTGFRSDMNGTKAVYLEDRCRARGQAFIRFDYSGHGQSEGSFDACTISDWLDDALAVLDTLTAGPVILVGSSLGGWLALRVAQERPDRIVGLIGLAAAPDFTRLLRDNELDDGQRALLARQGFIDLPNAYSPEPYRFTARLIEDGERHCLLEKEAVYRCPLILIQGMKDDDVCWQTAHRIKNTAPTAEIEVILVENGDHRLSRPEDLALIDEKLRFLCEKPPV